MLYNTNDLVFCHSCKVHLEKITEQKGFDKGSLTILKNPLKIFTVNYPLRMDNGTTRMISAFRVQYNNTLGPTKGGIRMHESVDLEDVCELAFLMSLKTSLSGLPFGGAKGGIKIDPKTLSIAELERVSRGYIGAIAPYIGPDQDIPAPDVNTDPRIMVWMLDEYEKIIGKKAPATITGKPPLLGGSLGRDTSTARGAFYIISELYKEKDPKEVRVAIQGFGNAGGYLADMLYTAGFRVVAVSDSHGGVYDENGLNIPQVAVRKKEKGLQAFSGEKITNDALLELPVDLLIPAALGGVITKDNAERIKATTVVEVANAPVNAEADAILTQKKTKIVPDILANAGGVIVSYFEWVQNLQNYYWSEEEVNLKLKEKILTAYNNVISKSKEDGSTLRDASYHLAIARIVEAEKMRGSI